MIIPEKIILLTGSETDDMRAIALEKYINSNVFGYHVIVVKERDITCPAHKLKDKIVTYGVRHNVNMLGFYDKLKKAKPTKSVKKVKDKNQSKGKYKYINNLVNRFNAKALFCLNTSTLYKAIKAKEKFGFTAKIVAFFDTFTFDKKTLLGADKYIVENMAFKEELVKKGVNKTDIVIKHFPLVEDVFVKETTDECKAMFDIDCKRTILLNGGVLGDYKVTEVLKVLTEVKDRFNIVVYLGENESLYQKLLKIKNENNQDNVKLLTTISNEEKLFKACDLIVTTYDQKAVYMAKAYTKPIIVFAPKRDVELTDFVYLDKIGEATYCKDITDIVTKAFNITNKDISKEVNVDELKTATAVTTNYLIELLQDKRM